jgi:signal transduction histidine kinase
LKSRFSYRAKQTFTKEFMEQLARVIAQTTLLREAEATSERWRRMVKSTSEMVAQVSHEIRTPLTLITEGTQQLLDGLQGSLSAGQKETLGRIRAQADRMIRLVTELPDG